jgi:diguanylate cyclase (GGDEF)-like protein
MVALTEADDERRHRAGGLAGEYLDPGLTRRLLPFAGVAILAEASLALPPGPSSWPYAIASLMLMATVGVLIAVLKRWPMPRGTTTLVPVIYVASAVALSLASGGGAKSGSGIVILIPLIWTALYQRRWESMVVSASIVVAMAYEAFDPAYVGTVVLLRRLLFWSALTVLISVSTHALRNRLQRTLRESEDARHQTDALRSVAEEMTTLLTTDQVLATATRWVAVLGSPPGSPGRRAQYARINGDTVSIVTQFDELGPHIIEPHPLTDNPNLLEVMRTGAPLSRTLSVAETGPSVRRLVTELGITDGVYVPVHCNGVVHGVLTVHLRGQGPSQQLFDCCQAIGHLTELALENARSHELMERMALTDALTGLMNRRAFDEVLAHRPVRLGFSLLVLDLDDMKHVNDSFGHGTGDDFLTHVAHVLTATVRAGDAVARLGGDEFAILLLNEGDRTGTETAGRILGAFSRAHFLGRAVTVSIGIASGDAGSDGERVLHAADAAMYAAKQQGGNRYALAATAEASAALHTPG